MSQSNPAVTAEALAFPDLFLKGRFSASWHQGRYDWQEKHVEALLKDLNDAVEENRGCYFLGTITLIKDKGDRFHWEIHDGQQRMMTVSLIFAALCRRFHHEEKEYESEILEILLNTGRKKAVNLDDSSDYPPRISPSEDDQTAYNMIIRGEPIKNSGISESALTTAWNAVETFFSDIAEEKLKLYFNFLMSRLQAVTLCLSSDMVFKLSPLDLGQLRLSVGYGTHKKGRPLSPVEVGSRLSRAHEAGISLEDCAKELQLDGTTQVGRFLRILELPQDLQRLIVWGASKDGIGFSAAVELKKIKDKADQRAVVESILADNLKSKEILRVAQLRAESGAPIGECLKKVLDLRPEIEK